MAGRATAKRPAHDPLSAQVSIPNLIGPAPATQIPTIVAFRQTCTANRNQVSIAWGVTHGEVFGTPVAEYLPVRLVRGRVVCQ
jgi:hypothetical protein